MCLPFDSPILVSEYFLTILYGVLTLIFLLYNLLSDLSNPLMNLQK
jgi:hypothetical protein